MNNVIRMVGLSLLCSLCVSLVSCNNGMVETDTEQSLNIMVYSQTNGWRHGSIEAGVAAIQQMGSENGVNVFATEDSTHFNDEELAEYDAVVFLSTTGTLFTDVQREAFENYIQNGGGYVGVHSATDTEYDWPWYNRLAGAYFLNHPPGTPDAVLDVVDQEHISTDMLPERWPRTDEWYNFRDLNEEVNVLITIDTDSYQGSRLPDYHPMAWYHEYDGGRAFYTALGHTEASFTEDTLFLDHLWGGIQYAMGVAQ